MDGQNINNKTFNRIAKKVSSCNFTDCVFNVSTTFDRCNLENCTFNASQHFLRTNVVKGTYNAECEFELSNKIEEEDLEILKLHRQKTSES